MSELSIEILEVSLAAFGAERERVHPQKERRQRGRARKRVCVCEKKGKENGEK